MRVLPPWNSQRRPNFVPRFLPPEPDRQGGEAADRQAVPPPRFAGERVVAYLGAGNRDPRQFTEPERLDLARADNAPLSFGGGIHYCLGAPLARLEAQVAFPALLRRFPKLELTGEPQRRDSLTIRGFTSLPVRFTA